MSPSRPPVYPQGYPQGGYNPWTPTVGVLTSLNVSRNSMEPIVVDTCEQNKKKWKKVFDLIKQLDIYIKKCAPNFKTYKILTNIIIEKKKRNETPTLHFDHECISQNTYMSVFQLLLKTIYI